jgi:hypothetical protein
MNLRMNNHAIITGAIGIAALAAACGSNSDVGGNGGNAGVGGNATGGESSGQSGAGTSASNSGGAGGVANSDVGGNAGTGGTSVAAATGTLGQPCSSPGQLACAGINQKLGLVCGANNTWQTNQTCNSATQVCDSRPGSTAGTCQEQDPVCATQTPGVQFCNAFAEWTCDAWGMKGTKVRDCPIGACVDGKCVDATGCSTASNFVSCASDCPSMLDASTRCSGDIVNVSKPPTDGNTGSAIAHQTYANAIAPDNNTSCPGRRYFRVAPMGYPDAYLYVRVSSPWKITTTLVLHGCSDVPGGETCVVLDQKYDGPTIYSGITVYTDDANAPDANVFVQASPVNQYTCP